MDRLILKKIKEFVDENKEIINENNFKEVYNKLYMEPTQMIGSFTQLFYKAGINPLQFLNHVPSSFLGMTDTTSFVIPNHITTIGNASFYNCVKLEKIKLPNNLYTIGSKAFAYCSHLKNIKIPAKIEKIENSTFEGCSRLESIYLNKDLKLIDEKVFLYCDNLKNIYFKGNFEEYNFDVNIYGNDSFFKAILHCNDGDYKMDKTWNWVKI